MNRELLKGYPVVVEQAVAWGEMDAYRHVNNVVYFRYFENARLAYIRRLDWAAFEAATGIGPILHSTSARFRKPLTFPDTIAIGARIASVAADRFVLQNIIVSELLGAVTTEGEGTIVTFHYERQEKVPVPAELRQRIAAIEGRAV
jgi:acyl-CoA thioester hydrolase